VILTKENSIKDVMGFSRYEFKLEPQAEVEFTVRESATYSNSLLSHVAVLDFLNRRAPDLLQKKILREDVHEELKKFVQRSELTTALSTIEYSTNNLKETDLTKWSTGSSVVRGGAILSSDILARVAEILEMRANIAESQRQIDYNQKLIEKVFNNQTRLRGNIESLEKAKVTNSQLMNRYLADFEKEEDELKKRRQTIEDLEQHKVKLDKDLVSKSRELTTLATKQKEEIRLNKVVPVIAAPKK